MNSKLKQFLKILLMITPLSAALTWTVEPSFRTLLATIVAEPLELGPEQFDNVDANTDLKRKIQKHFLNFKVYIPLEDIVTLGPHSTEKMMIDMMRRSCGKAYVYVWTPMGFRLPFVGEKFIDRCWKPQVTMPS